MDTSHDTPHKQNPEADNFKPKKSTDAKKRSMFDKVEQNSHHGSRAFASKQKEIPAYKHHLNASKKFNDDPLTINPVPSFSIERPRSVNITSDNESTEKSSMKKKKKRFEIDSMSILVDSQLGILNSQHPVASNVEKVKARRNTLNALIDIKNVFEKKKNESFLKQKPAMTPRKSSLKAKRKTQGSKILKENLITRKSSVDSDTNSDFDRIIYDPNERGCQRDGLRVRKFARPWWIHDGSAKNIGIVYTTYPPEDMKLNKKLKCK